VTAAPREVAATRYHRHVSGLPAGYEVSSEHVWGVVHLLPQLRTPDGLILQGRKREMTDAELVAWATTDAAGRAS
jgi:hypothetical protein